MHDNFFEVEEHVTDVGDMPQAIATFIAVVRHMGLSQAKTLLIGAPTLDHELTLGCCALLGLDPDDVIWTRQTSPDDLPYAAVYTARVLLPCECPEPFVMDVAATIVPTGKS